MRKPHSVLFRLMFSFGKAIMCSTGKGSMRVLVVEDDKKIASFVKKGLGQAGFAVDHVPSAEDAM